MLGAAFVTSSLFLCLLSDVDSSSPQLGTNLVLHSVQLCGAYLGFSPEVFGLLVRGRKVDFCFVEGLFLVWFWLIFLINGVFLWQEILYRNIY